MLTMRRLLALGLIIVASAAMLALTPSSLEAFPQNGGSETSTGNAPAGGAELTHTDQLPGKIGRAHV